MNVKHPYSASTLPSTYTHSEQEGTRQGYTDTINTHTVNTAYVYMLIQGLFDEGQQEVSQKQDSLCIYPQPIQTTQLLYFLD